MVPQPIPDAREIEVHTGYLTFLALVVTLSHAK